MYTETRTLLPIYRWAQLMGIDPLHFSQVLVESLKPATVCATPWFSYEWQNSDRVGREAVARAIATAEQNMARVLGFKLLPSWEVNERQSTTPPFPPGVVNYAGTDVNFRRPAIRLDWGYLRTFGQRAKTLIAASSGITWTDENGDGYSETGTVIAATTVTDTNEIAVYHPGHSGDDRYEIRPLMSVDITAGTLTVTFRRELTVLPDFYTAIAGDMDAANGTDDNDFEAEVDIYRVYTDPATQVQMLWEPWSECGCDTGTCESCVFGAANGCMMIRNKVAGLASFFPAEYDADAGTWTATTWGGGRLPDQLRVWYKAGFTDEAMPRPQIDMSSQWEMAVALYAVALLDRDLCECNNVHAFTERWRSDRAASQPEGTTYTLSDEGRDNRFGTREGAIYAWQRVSREERLGYAARI